MLSYSDMKNGKQYLPQPLPIFMITTPKGTKGITIDMITIFNSTFNTLSQNYYNKTIDSLHFHNLTCSCGHSACLNKHAYYYRFIKTPLGKMRLRICRVKCSLCGTTHALLLAEMVPYSQIPLISQIYIAGESMTASPDYSSVMAANPEIDESNIASVLRQFNRFWKERLLSQGISLADHNGLIHQAFAFFRRQFMQIKCTPNILFSIPT